jgi:hypothetical protein
LTNATNNGIIKRVIEMKGNIVFFKKSDSFISRMVANITKSEFTHVGLIIDFNDETQVATIIESNRFITTRIITTEIDDNHVVYSVGNIMTEEVMGRVVEYANKQLGTKYDYLQILGLFLSLLSKGDRYAFFNSSNKIICSELIDVSYYKAGIPRKNDLNIGNITPQELLEVYELSEI